jgi:Immunity protein 52
MSKLAFRYNIRSDLPSRPEDPAALGGRFLSTVDALSRIDPNVFHDWQIMKYRAAASLPLETARARMTSIIEKAVYRNDLRQPQPQYGYTAGALVINADKSRNISLRIKTGGTTKGDTSLETGEWNVFPDPAIVTYPLFKAALLAIVENWPPIWACAYAFRLNTVMVPVSYPGGVQGSRSEHLPMIPTDPTFQDSIFHVPWIAYLSSPLAASVTLPREITTERGPDGGLLMIATTERLDPENPEHLQRARLILETMLARTGYSTYAAQHG